ncbi:MULTISPECIES: hypothetical protein [unclassified Endozoicomonas]|uniref:hypothetical protein n=1 Tax=unclassified Endozoicomonas TaxID=2644528 RepID=UPI003BB57C1F
MEPVTWGFVGTLLGVIVGASSSILTTIITARNNRKIQQDKNSYERSEKAREFQRENFIKLQDSLTNIARLITKAHLEDVQYFRKNPDSKSRPMLSNELDNEIRVSNTNVAILIERVANDMLRNNINMLHSEMTNVLMTKNERDSTSALNQAHSLFQSVMKDIGSALRQHY